MSAPDKKKQKQSCFAIAPIGAKDSETRKRSDKVLKHLFRKALEDKFKVERGDEIDEPGMITSQVLRAVQDADLVVADLTEHNPNVLYELAVRHAIEKPIIHVIEPRLSKIPFDIGGFRTIEFDLTDPDSIEIAVEKLRKFAEQAEAGHWGETPIKLANIMRASKDDSPEMLLLKQAVEGISMVSDRVASFEALLSIRKFVNSPEECLRRLGNRTTHQNPDVLNNAADILYRLRDFAIAAEAKRAIKDSATRQAATTAKEDATENGSRPAEQPKPVNPADPRHSKKRSP